MKKLLLIALGLVYTWGMIASFPYAAWAGSCPTGALVAGTPTMIPFTFHKLDATGEDGTANKKIEIYRWTGSAREYWIGASNSTGSFQPQASRAGNAMIAVPTEAGTPATLSGRFDYIWTPPAANAGEWVVIDFYDDAGLDVGTSCAAYINAVPVDETVKKLRR